MTLDGILVWLAEGDDDEVCTRLISLTETDRKALGPVARKWLTHGNPTRVSRPHSALAVLATAGGPRQAMIAPTQAFGLGSAFLDPAVTILQAQAAARRSHLTITPFAPMRACTRRVLPSRHEWASTIARGDSPRVSSPCGSLDGLASG